MNSAPYSKASTPNPTVTSDVNSQQFQPSRTQTPAPKMAASNNTDLPQKLRIAHSLENYECIINELVESIGAFKPKQNLIPEIIQAEEDLTESVEELSKHQEAARTIKNLQQESDSLSQKLNELLIGLSDCRRSLQALPGAESVRNGDDQDTVSAKELLSYATKITKFTHAPPGYDPQMPEHANFPWPTEDELRRGMMAFLAMNSEEDENLQAVDEKTLNSIKNDNPVNKNNGKNDNATNDNNNNNNPTSTGKRRSSSMVSYGERPVIDPSAAPNKGGAADSNNSAVLDLDLFDPDEDDD